MWRKVVLGLLGAAGAVVVLGGGLYLHDVIVGERPWHLITEEADGTARELARDLSLDQCEKAAVLRSQEEVGPDLEAAFDDVAAKIRCAISNNPAECERKSPAPGPERAYRCGYRCHWGEGTACLFKRKKITG